MLASLCLFTCALLPAQAESPPAWLLVPHLSRGQELVYNGSFKEEVVGQAVQFSRNYGLESRVLVLETQAAGARLSLLTTLKQREPGPARPEAPNSAEGSEISSVRLELARLDLQGHLTSETGRSLAVALEGPATVETGAFVPFPNNRVGGDQPWEVNEEGRPPWTWRAAGTEPVNGLPCLKLVGVQQSPDWDRPRADRTAWRRQDTVWVSARLGIASRVERTIEQREPARREATHRSVATLELQSSLVYPAPLLEDCRQEILRAQSFAEAAEPLAREPGQGG
ncbi:MAG: hypothetical protein JO112_03610, partial [Planctomycetes bacterium]|nr:hypothetical protein [Planctomycetota bacterium]